VNTNLLDFSETMRQIMQHPTASFSNLAEGVEDVHVHLPVASVERLHGNIETVCRELNRCDQEEIYLFCPTEAEIKRLTELFADLKPFKESRLYFIKGRLSSGFKLLQKTENRKQNIKSTKKEPKTENTQQHHVSNIPLSVSHSAILLLSVSELLERHEIRRPQRRQLGQVIDSFLDLKPGDFVVHVAYGIARYRGIKTLMKGQQEEEHLHLDFADSQVLYVPISKIGLVQKYVAGNRYKPKLAKIGSQLWSRHKKAVQEAVFDLAEEMIELQARREAKPGIAFPADSNWQREFDALFPFRETNDQLLAIEAVKHDMELPRPMDRLLCGDVGFGKTEVAIRAAFKAVDAGYQVAVLVPTTILAEQHVKIFSERMREFPITVAALSRFQTKMEQKKIIEHLAAGTIDIVIGTHRIVSSDISFHNLGLAVIDEEQRFGVHHKERLKLFRDSVDVLTMTATPIPRTLHFSLLGIREISNLETPPEDRLAVETRVVRFNEELIRSAVLRELNRNGQIFFVHNRVYDIEELAEQIQRIVPECRIGIGHAQMPDEELEEVMKAFVDHQFDMLLSTTIIESGLDIPNANTIFIDEADRYGLADLHQLRGRVGRYKYQAYCYLLLGRNQMLHAQAAKRLRAIEEYAHLGSGFHLAMRDLEIRGAGNILGTQQSGHIAAVGYEMYCQFLETAVRTLKQLPPKTVIEVELDLPGVAVIPMSYVTDQRIKIDLYRRLTRVTTLEECTDLHNEMIDRFGQPPSEVQRLLIHSKIRVLAHSYRIRTIKLESGIAGDSGYVVLDYAAQPLMDKLREKLKRQNRTIRFTSDRHAYIPLPPNLSRNSDPDIILRLVVEILSNPEQPIVR
jgi:transcription-repair coupling factor (superfamily II helicase)